MDPQLIELSDGILVEVFMPENRAHPISKTNAKQVKAAFKKLSSFLPEVGRNLQAAWREINQDMTVKEAEIELGLSFESEGNIYIAKGTAGANLTVKITLLPTD